MARKRNDIFRCIVCGGESTKAVICFGCEANEMESQKKEPGSITDQQVWFIRNKTGADEISIQEAVRVINEDCIWDIENLSCSEGKKLISILLNKESEQ